METLEKTFQYPHQQRVVEEAKELKIKTDALREFILNNKIFLNQTSEEQNRLREQCKYMQLYLEILIDRIDNFYIINIMENIPGVCFEDLKSKIDNLNRIFWKEEWEKPFVYKCETKEERADILLALKKMGYDVKNIRNFKDYPYIGSVKNKSHSSCFKSFSAFGCFLNRVISKKEFIKITEIAIPVEVEEGVKDIYSDTAFSIGSPFKVGDPIIEILTGIIYDIVEYDNESTHRPFRLIKKGHSSTYCWMLLDGRMSDEDKYPTFLHFREDYDYSKIDFNNLPKRK